MPVHIVVVESLKDWHPHFPRVPVVAATDYLSRAEYLKTKGIRVINLCRSYRYLSTGYFCSLLAEPRSHRVIPTVSTLTSLSSKALYSLNVEDLGSVIQKRFNRLLKFTAVPSALPLKDGFVLCAEGPIGSEFPARAGFHPPLGGSWPPFGEFRADTRLGGRPPPAEQPSQPGLA